MSCVIGLTGYAQSGKDTAANGLIAEGWTRVGFADGVKELALKCDPYILWRIESKTQGWSHGAYRALSGTVASEGWEAAKKQDDVRKFLQNLGTGARHVLGNEVWVTLAMKKAIDAIESDTSVVFSDLRFPNEAGVLRGYEGEVFDCPTRIVRIARPGVGPVNNHISETAIDQIEVDHTIVNDVTPEELQAKLVEYARSLESVNA